VKASGKSKDLKEAFRVVWGDGFFYDGSTPYTGLMRTKWSIPTGTEAAIAPPRSKYNTPAMQGDLHIPLEGTR
jgi:hypothetical protein